MAIAISELDFKLDDFQKQKVITGTDAYATLIKRLLLMRKATYPTLPDMGVDIGAYRFSDIDTLIAGDLKNVIRTQINKYIVGVPLQDVSISKIKYGNDYVLFVDIILLGEIKEINYAFLQKKYEIISTNVKVVKQKLINQQGVN